LNTINEENISPKQEKPFEELIQDLISRRKLQTEALSKIKASMEKKHSEEATSNDNTLNKKTS